MIDEFNKLLYSNKIITQSIAPSWVNQGINTHILRLDLIHPVISGNKFFKLKYYLDEAEKRDKRTIITFGGAYSNHLLATACACNLMGFKCVGIVRGEKPAIFSSTIKAALEYGMELYFLNRSAYKEKKIPFLIQDHHYIIPEGGYGIPGARGASEILDCVTGIKEYTHIICASGTGTMTAGLTNAINSHQQVISVSVLKENYSLQTEIKSLLTEKGMKNDLKIIHDYHFGGYAKYNPELLDSMKELWTELNLPTDFVYTAKAMYGIKQLIQNDYFKVGDNLLFIHSGGLQGNHSLPVNTLPF